MTTVREAFLAAVEASQSKLAGFALVQLEDGAYDWFPTGHPVSGEILSKWVWRGEQWVCIA